MDLKIRNFGKRLVILVTEPDSNQDREITTRETPNMEKWFIHDELFYIQGLTELRFKILNNRINQNIITWNFPPKECEGKLLREAWTNDMRGENFVIAVSIICF